MTRTKARKARTTSELRQAFAVKLGTIAPKATAPAQEATALSVCTDCLFILANGETGDEQETAAHLERMNSYGGDVEITLGALCEEGHDPCSEEHAEQCERLGFSWTNA